MENGFPGLTLPLVEESETTLLIGNEPIQTFLCTPEALEELAVGHLYCRGMIDTAEQISQIEISSEKTGELERFKIKLQLEEKGSSKRIPPEGSRLPAVALLQDSAGRIQDRAEKYRSHGGIHCAALSDGHDIVALYEDVGRHNAFDKAIGAAVMKGISPSRLIYFSSGRINSEIAEKAAVCRLPLLVSRSIATTRACSIAGKYGICIIGRIESKTPIMYTACARG